MRILQIIDSLEAGGAERMAVNYANALVDEIDFSGLVATRKEGSLLNQIHPNVSYLFLKKKKKIDFGALLRFRSFVIKNKVTHIHAHSTSFFLAFLLKLMHPSVKLIWHYHYGNNEILSKKRVYYFKIVISFFSGVIAVNQKLKFWIVNNLKSNNVIYLPNFPGESNHLIAETILKGNEKRIISLANLREDKNHFLLLEVAQKLKKTHPYWTFHLVGKDFEDDYSNKIKEHIVKYKLENNVFIYGSKQDVSAVLKQSEIAILTSISEGLPVALLEYGLHQKAVVVTNVGEIPMIIKDGINGFIVGAKDANLFHQRMVELIQNENLRIDFGNELLNTIQESYTADSVITNYLKWLQTF